MRKKRGKRFEKALEYIESLPIGAKFTSRDIANFVYADIDSYAARCRASQLMSKIWKHWNSTHKDIVLLKNREKDEEKDKLKRNFVYTKSTQREMLRESLEVTQSSETQRFVSVRKNIFKIAEKAGVPIEDLVKIVIQTIASKEDPYSAARALLAFLNSLPLLQQKAMPALKEITTKQLPKSFIDTEQVNNVYEPQI